MRIHRRALATHRQPIRIPTAAAPLAPPQPFIFHEFHEHSPAVHCIYSDSNVRQTTRLLNKMQKVFASRRIQIKNARDPSVSSVAERLERCSRGRQQRLTTTRTDCHSPDFHTQCRRWGTVVAVEGESASAKCLVESRPRSAHIVLSRPASNANAIRFFFAAFGWRGAERVQRTERVQRAQRAALTPLSRAACFNPRYYTRFSRN